MTILEHNLSRRLSSNEVEYGLCWHVTWACNLRCAHCLSDTWRQRKDVLGRELSTDEAIRLLEIGGACGVRKVGFSGGEPLLRHDMRLLVQRCVELSMRVTLTSNGILLDADWLGFLTANGVKVKISLDGMKKGHEALRGRGTFKRAVQAVKSAVRAHTDVEVNCVVTPVLVQEIRPFLRLLNTIGVKSVAFLSFVPRESGACQRHLQVNEVHMEIVEQAGRDQLDQPGSLQIVKLHDYVTAGSRKLVVEPDGQLVARGLDRSDDLLLGYALERFALMRALDNNLQETETTLHR